MFCRLCGRALTDPDSIARGVGPVCCSTRRIKDKDTMALFDAHFDIVREDVRFIAIVDMDIGRSVTNDAENVVQRLHEDGRLNGNKRIFYRDTAGQWDELVHDYGKFIGFRGHGCTTLEALLEKEYPNA